MSNIVKIVCFHENGPAEVLQFDELPLPPQILRLRENLTIRTQPFCFCAGGLWGNGSNSSAGPRAISCEQVSS